jgi:hypothetical protein
MRENPNGNILCVNPSRDKFFLTEFLRNLILTLLLVLVERKIISEETEYNVPQSPYLADLVNHMLPDHVSAGGLRLR